jgi:flagellar protein FlaG
MAISTIGNTGSSPPVHPAAPSGSSPVPAAAASAVAPAPAPQQPGPEQVQKAVESIKQMVKAAAPNSLEFSIDDETGKTIVRVTDVETGEMIRQIPSKELLEIARSLDKLQGLMLKEKA